MCGKRIGEGVMRACVMDDECNVNLGSLLPLIWMIGAQVESVMIMLNYNVTTLAGS